MDLSGIFRQTQVNLYTETTSANSFSFLRSSSTLALPPIKSKPNLEWTEFLKSTQQVGNYKQTSKPLSTKLLRTLDKAQNLSFDNKLRTKPRQLDTYLLLKKERLNTLKCQIQNRQEKLEKLKTILKDLEESQPSQIEDLRKVLDFRYNQIYDLSQGINNELYYQGNLKHMQKIRKQSNQKQKQKISNFQRDNKLLEAKVKEEQKRKRRVYQAVVELKKQVKAQKKKKRDDQISHQLHIKNLLKQFKQACQIYQSINIQKSNTFSYTQRNSKTKDLIYLQNVIMSLQKMEVFNGEKNTLKKRKEKFELKIKEIRQKTGMANINLIVPYYTYLQEKQKLLDSQFQSAIFQLQQKKIELKEAKYILSTLNYSRQQEEDIPQIQPQVESEILDFQLLKELENLVMMAVNVFTRVHRQIIPDRFRRDVFDMDLGYLISLCLYKLEKYMDAIHLQKNYRCEESVNTNIEYEFSPDYLNLRAPMSKLKNIENQTDCENLETRET